MNPKVAHITYIFTPVILGVATTVAVHQAIKQFNTSTATHCGVYIADTLAGIAAFALGVKMIDPLYPIAIKAFN